MDPLNWNSQVEPIRSVYDGPSTGPPTARIVPLEERLTDQPKNQNMNLLLKKNQCLQSCHEIFSFSLPCRASHIEPLPTNLLPNFSYVVPLNTNIHVAPFSTSSKGLPTARVLPFEDRLTDQPGFQSHRSSRIHVICLSISFSTDRLTLS